MLLYIVRHGIAIDRDDPDCPPEAERYLTSKGIDKTREAARGFLSMGAKPEALFSSPYLRAMQTAELFCDALKIPASKIKKTDALKPEAPPKLFLEELSKAKVDEAICFGHAPHVDELIAHVTRASRAFTEVKKAGAACLEIKSFGPAEGALVWLVTAHTLRDLD
jgi:phosphohistidine phosphatase